MPCLGWGLRSSPGGLHTAGCSIPGAASWAAWELLAHCRDGNGWVLGALPTSAVLWLSSPSQSFSHQPPLPKTLLALLLHLSVLPAILPPAWQLGCCASYSRCSPRSHRHRTAALELIGEKKAKKNTIPSRSNLHMRILTEAVGLDSRL